MVCCSVNNQDTMILENCCPSYLPYLAYTSQQCSSHWHTCAWSPLTLTLTKPIHVPISLDTHLFNCRNDSDSPARSLHRVASPQGWNLKLSLAFNFYLRCWFMLHADIAAGSQNWSQTSESSRWYWTKSAASELDLLDDAKLTDKLVILANALFPAFNDDLRATVLAGHLDVPYASQLSIPNYHQLVIHEYEVAGWQVLTNLIQNCHIGSVRILLFCI